MLLEAARSIADMFKWISLLVVGTTIWIMLWKFFSGIKKVRAAEERVEREFARINELSIGEAKNEALAKLTELAPAMSPWDSPIPDSVRTILASLDPSIRGLFERYKMIHLPQSGTVLSSRLFKFSEDSKTWQIGVNEADGYKLEMKAGSPRVLATAGEKTTDSYRSIFHYILIME